MINYHADQQTKTVKQYTHLINYLKQMTGCLQVKKSKCVSLTVNPRHQQQLTAG